MADRILIFRVDNNGDREYISGVKSHQTASRDPEWRYTYVPTEAWKFTPSSGEALLLQLKKKAKYNPEYDDYTYHSRKAVN